MPAHIKLADISVQGGSMIFGTAESTESISVGAIVNGSEVVFAATPSFSGKDDLIKFGFRTAALTLQSAEGLESVKLKIQSDRPLSRVSHSVVGYWLTAPPEKGFHRFVWYGYDFSDLLDLFSFQEMRPVWNRATRLIEDTLVTVRAPFQITIEGATAEVTIDVKNIKFVEGQQVDLDPVALTGAAQEVTWAGGANPAAQNISVPADATAAYMFWSYFYAGSGYGLNTVTLDSADADQKFELPGGSSDETATGVAVWYNPATGTRSLDVSWDQSPAEGATTSVCYVKGGNLTSWRDADADHKTGSTAPSVTIDTNTDDLVLAHEQNYYTTPTLPSGWTSILTGDNNHEYFRLSNCNSPGASSTTYNGSSGGDYGSVVAISIPVGSSAIAISPNDITSLAIVKDVEISSGGTVCWGHDTGVTQANVRDFTGNWSGTGSISGGGDSEQIQLDGGEYMESETWNYGVGNVEISLDQYATGSGNPSMQYKNGDSQANCEADTWHDYTGQFACTGWLKIKLNG